MANSVKVVEKKTRYGVDGKTGERTKIGTAVKLDNGKQTLLLNPNGKGKKFAKELKDGIRYTNTGEIKRDKKGKPKRLTKVQRAFRIGYLQSRKDGANAFKGVKK